MCDSTISPSLIHDKTFAAASAPIPLENVAHAKVFACTDHTELFCAPKDMSTTASTSFIPTGLLGSSSKSHTSKDVFIPTGLFSTAPASTFGPDNAFKPNGLLGLGQHATSTGVLVLSMINVAQLTVT